MVGLLLLTNSGLTGKEFLVRSVEVESTIGIPNGELELIFAVRSNKDLVGFAHHVEETTTTLVGS